MNKRERSANYVRKFKNLVEQQKKQLSESRRSSKATVNKKNIGVKSVNNMILLIQIV